MVKKSFATEELKADTSLPLNALKKTNILKAAAFTSAFAQVTRKIHTRHFTFLISQRQEIEPAIGIIIGKKKVKTAVRRNLCRRLIKEAFRQHKTLFINTHVVAIAKAEAFHATRDELWDSINLFLKKYA
ncbi:MAG: ribonuclease P protein component [Francisellaceae bacterium]